MNRKIHLFQCILSFVFMLPVSAVLSDDSKAVFSPKFSPDGKYLIWLQRDNTGPHDTVSELVKCDWETKEVCSEYFALFTPIIYSF